MMRVSVILNEAKDLSERTAVRRYGPSDSSGHKNSLQSDGQSGALEDKCHRGNQARTTVRRYSPSDFSGYEIGLQNDWQSGAREDKCRRGNEARTAVRHYGPSDFSGHKNSLQNEKKSGALEDKCRREKTPPNPPASRGESFHPFTSGGSL